MLDFEEIEKYYDPPLPSPNPKAVLLEYLEHEFLDSLYKCPGSEKLSFKGGTAVRLIHQSRRFSEGLSFDGFGLNYPAFVPLIKKACLELRYKGINAEWEFSETENLSGCIKFPDVLSWLELTSLSDENIFINVDAEQREKIFSPEVKVLKRFGVLRCVKVNPLPVLLSQKLVVILFGGEIWGGDFYDAAFLIKKTAPDFDYIKKAAGLEKGEFRQKLKKYCAKIDYKKLAESVESLLIDKEDINRIINFKENIEAAV